MVGTTGILHPGHFLRIQCVIIIIFLEFTDSGLECATQCGQDGLFEGRYWCHTADAWDFCNPQLAGMYQI